MRRALALLALAALLTAAKPLPWGKQASDIARVEHYLTALTTLVADFEQIDAAGGIASGKFYLKRPGKMRWEYAPPTPILLVSNGRVLTYYDAQLDQVNYIPVEDTLAGFLGSTRITLDSATTKLTAFTAKEGTVRATLVQKDKPDEGSLTLEFSDAPLQLRQLVMTDASGQRTHINLQNARFGEALPDTLFTFEDPRGTSKRRRR